MSTIIIPVDANTAKLYAEASKDTPAKLQFLLRLWLREYCFQLARSQKSWTRSVEKQSNVA
jgi:hypothetical protein